MIWSQPLIALLLSLLFGVVLVLALNWRQTRRGRALPSLVFGLLLLFPLLWAAALWVAPNGPSLFNVGGVPLVMIGLLFGLLIAALVAPQFAPVRRMTGEGSASDEVAPRPGTLFWILLVAALAAVITGFLAF